MTIDPNDSDLSARYTKYLKHHGFNILAGVLMILGIILAFFYIQIGGALVGLAVGISFYDELQKYFFHAREYATVEGLFKTLMLVGLLLYLLLAATAFVIAVVIAFVIMSVLHLLITKT